MNDPVNYIDPDGRQKWEASFGGCTEFLEFVKSNVWTEAGRISSFSGARLTTVCYSYLQSSREAAIQERGGGGLGGFWQSGVSGDCKETFSSFLRDMANAPWLSQEERLDLAPGLLALQATLDFVAARGLARRESLIC
jgi:hypothetical protein